jgi:hypothetical protein
LAKESHELECSQQRDLQVAASAAADTCFTVHFTTSSLKNSGSSDKFYIAGYEKGYVPLECQKKGAECDITICGKNTLDICTSAGNMWRFSIIGDIGPLVYHVEHPTSGKEFHAGFPTKMGGKASVFQSYQLVLNPTKKAQEWIATDSFTSSDGIIAVSRIVIHYIYYGRINEECIRLKMLLYCPHSHLVIRLSPI